MGKNTLFGQPNARKLTSPRRRHRMKKKKGKDKTWETIKYNWFRLKYIAHISRNMAFSVRNITVKMDQYYF